MEPGGVSGFKDSHLEWIPGAAHAGKSCRVVVTDHKATASSAEFVVDP